MANKQAIVREAERGKKLLEEHSRYLQAQYDAWRRDRMMFPSLDPASRKWVSPLGGEAAFPWGRKKEG